MKTLFGLFLFFVFTGSLSAQNPAASEGEYVRFYHPDSTLASEGYLENGKPNGYWKNYYPNGNLKSEGNRKFFQLDGPWIFYNEEGDTLEIIDYRKDMKNGYHIRYEYFTNDKGMKIRQLLFRELFFNNQQELVSEYYRDGFLFQEVNYENGVKQGLTKEYDTAGNLVTILNYRNNILLHREAINRFNQQGQKHGVWKSFHPNNQLKTEANYDNGLLHGTFKEYDSRGQLIKVLRYNQGIPIVEKMETQDAVSYRKDFYSNGTLKQAGGYIDTIPVGMHRYYREDGSIELAKEFDDTGLLLAEGILDENAKKTGKWKEFYSDGSVKALGTYKNGKKNGEWVYYFPGGQVEQRGSFSNDRFQGPWTWYYETGEIWRTEEFYRGKENGMSIEYLKDGTIIDQGEYIDGLREGTWMHQVGDHVEKGEYINGFKEGTWKYYYTNGELKFKGSFIQGQEDGKQVWYYENGKTEWEKYYIYGSREKTWRQFNEDGTLYLSITYRDDKEIRVNGKDIQSDDE